MPMHLRSLPMLIDADLAIDKTLLLHDSVLRDLYQKLLPLLQPPPDPPRLRIGFGKQGT